MATKELFMSATASESSASSDKILVHPVVVRITHWINVVAMFVIGERRLGQVEIEVETLQAGK